MVIHTCKISALRKMQQEEANLDYIARPCLKKKQSSARVVTQSFNPPLKRQSRQVSEFQASQRYILTASNTSPPTLINK